MMVIQEMKPVSPEIETPSHYLGIDIGTTTIDVAEITSEDVEILSADKGYQNCPAVFNLLTHKCGRDAKEEEQTFNRGRTNVQTFARECPI